MGKVVENKMLYYVLLFSYILVLFPHSGCKCKSFMYVDRFLCIVRRLPRSFVSLWILKRSQTCEALSPYIALYLSFMDFIVFNFAIQWERVRNLVTIEFTQCKVRGCLLFRVWCSAQLLLTLMEVSMCVSGARCTRHTHSYLESRVSGRRCILARSNWNN